MSMEKPHLFLLDNISTICRIRQPFTAIMMTIVTIIHFRHEKTPCHSLVDFYLLFITLDIDDNNPQ